MYLSDKDLKEIWPTLNIECDNLECEADCVSHIQPCSVDFCLSNVFWEPKKRSSIDLRKSALLKLAPRRYWKRRVLRKNEYITLKPGKLLLGRLAPKLTIPKDCAGKIEGRSSFARLGLGIHCTGEFINPGYRGHMPLELYNYSPNPIKIFPYIPICQLMLVKLSGPPDHLYGTGDLQSKYMDDDGGPSYWWQDKRIKSLHKVFSEKSVELFVQEQLLEKIGIQDPEIIERFEALIEKKPMIGRENSELLIEEFTRSEDGLRKRDKILNGIGKVALPVAIGGSIKIGFGYPFSYLQYIVWAITVCCVWPFLWALKETPRQYLGEKE
jgi:deoxycytidine triphosphate deaminase